MAETGFKCGLVLGQPQVTDDKYVIGHEFDFQWSMQ